MKRSLLWISAGLALRLNDWPIKKKLSVSAYAYAATVLTLILLGFTNLRIKGWFIDEFRETSKAETFFHQSSIILHDWEEALEKTVMLDIPFQKDLDPEKCDLGRLFSSYYPRLEGIETHRQELDAFHLASHRIAQKIVSLNGQLNVLHVYSDEALPALKNFENKLADMQRILEDKQEKTRALIKNLDIMFYAVLALFAVVSFLLLFFQSKLSQSISEPLELLTSATIKIAQGNLQVNLNVGERRDEIGRLGRSFQNMADNMRKMNTQLVRSEKMSAVGQLAAGIAHEINNPLGVILGFAQGMARRLKPGDPAELSVKSIEREAIRCKNLVQDLLTFSRSSAADRQPMDLNLILEGVISLIQAQGKMGNVSIRKEFQNDLPRVLCNPSQIQQIVVNLANNALDAMPKGGYLAFATSLLKDRLHSWVSLKISDTGEGIPPEVIENIFDPFFTTKEVGKGTGLGLSLVYEIVKKHSGDIEVTSRPGFTEFCVRLPAASVQEAAAHG